MLKNLYLHAKQLYPMLRCKKSVVPSSSLFNIVMVLSFLMLGSQNANATHAVGADLTYICISPNTFEVTLNVYRDCNGINLPGSQQVSWVGVGAGCNGAVTANRAFETDITPICPTQQSSCNNGTGAFGVEQHTYIATITVPPGCTDLTFSWRLCCRNNAITTLIGSPSMYVESHYIDNSLVPCNNSPIFLNPPASFSCIGNQVFYNHGAVDLDGDSLSFSLTPCLASAAAIVNYAAGFSGLNPFGVANPVTIDPSTGAITFNPTILHVGVLCVLVEEYRNGVLIGSVMRDIQFRVLPCTNISPVVSGVNNQGIDSIDFIITTCFGSQLCFDVVGTDANLGDVLTMFDNGAIPNTSFTVSGPGVPSNNDITGTFCWTPTPFDLGTHTFTVTIQDDACPLVGSNTFTYVIIVQDNQDTVEAGLDVSICIGDTTDLLATTMPSSAVSYSWSPTLGLSNPTSPGTRAYPPSTTTYTVSALFANGCIATDVVTVTVEDDPALAASPNGINVCASSSLTLAATTDATGMNFYWTHLSGGSCFPMFPDSSTGIITGPTSQLPVTMCSDVGTYTFQVIATNPFTGCSSTEIITLTIGVVPVEPACRNIYASTTGSAGALGSQFDPVTLQEALLRSACNNSVIKLATGTYDVATALNITSNLTLEGGFIQGQAWTKTSEIGATTINRLNTPNGGIAAGVLNANRHLTALEMFGSSGFRLQDLTITTDDAVVPGTSTYGIFMNGASNYNITRVNVEPGAASTGSAGSAGCNGGAGVPGVNGGLGNVDGVDLDVLGGNGGNGANSCTSGAFLLGGQPGRNISHGIAPIGDGGIGTSSGANIVDGGAGGGGGRGGPAADGGAGGAGGRAGTPNTSAGAGCSATGSGLGSNVLGGNGGIVNTLHTNTPGFANGTPGLPGDPGIDGTDGCPGAVGSAGQLVTACRYQIGAQGSAGMSGSGGSGGGGGGGGGGQICAACTDGTGHGGGGGGAGGAGGTGGVGAFGGGASFGIYMCSNGANGFIEHCHVLAGTSGAGGTGGGGGTGGAAGAAGLGELGATPADAEVQAGGNGGIGGIGGNGGVGGDGAPGSSIRIFWDGTGTSPVAQDSTYALYNQQIIYAENTNCTNADVMYWDSSTVATHPLTTALPQIMPIGLALTTVTNWIFDSPGLNTVPATGTFNADTTIYNTVARYDVIHNTCVGCPPAGGPAGIALEEYRGFHNIAFDKTFKPEILSSANVIGLDTFQLCIGDFATFESSMFGDTTRWQFAGAITNPGNIQFVPSTQFNITGFFMIELFLITDCCGDTPVDTAWIYVDPVPAVVGNGNFTICQGDSVNLAVAGLTPTDTIIWTPLTALDMLTQDSVNVHPLVTTVYNASVYAKIITNGITRLACPTGLSFTVTVNPLPTAVMTSTDVVCNNDGTATATPAPGLYNFTWSHGINDLSIASSTVISLAPGSYCVTIEDVITGCVDTNCIFVAPAAVVPTVFAAGVTPVTCAGADDGIVTIGTANGTAPYTYVWDTIVPGIVSPTSVDNTVSGLAPRDYIVTVTDNLGCQSVVTFNIPTPDSLSITILDTIHPVCQSGNDGRIEIEGVGGTGLITYAWSTGVTADSGILAPLDTGFYCVTITDQNNCSEVFCINLDAQQVIVASPTVSVPVACNGGTACLTAGASGGSGAYSYTWSGGNLGAPITTGTDTTCGIFSASAALYIVVITDSTYGCTTTASVSISEPSALTATVSSQIDVRCFADSSGNAVAGASGGTAPYTFLWDANTNNQTNKSVTGLAAGIYCCTITDTFLCAAVTCVTITQPASSVDVSTAITSVFNGQDITCFGENDGEATATGSAGTPGTTGYVYQWGVNAANQTGPVATGLTVANNPYQVFITDSLNCIDSSTIVITQPIVLAASLSSSVSISCFADSTGSATISQSGGTSGYTYQWSIEADSQQTATATGLNVVSAPYDITVTDVNGCQDSLTFTPSQPVSAITSSANVVQHATCNGFTNGIVAVTSSGGTGAITYTWGGGAAAGMTTDTLFGLGAGTYCVTVVDANLCTNVHCVVVTQPSAVTATISNFTDVICNADSTGTATVVGSGGNTGYTFLWTNGQTTATNDSLFVGTHSVTVTDDSLCTAVTTVTIGQPTLLTAAASVYTNYNGAQISCLGATDGCVTVVGVGGLGSYSYSWSSPGATDSLCALGAGAYTVTVTDSVGCVAAATTTITPPTAVVASITGTINVACTNDSTGSLAANGAGGTGAAYTFVWDDLSTGATNANLPAGVQCVTVSDINSCEATICATLTQPSAVVTAVITVDSTVSCFGGSDAGVHVVALGGTPSTVMQANGTGYTYVWGNTSTDTSSVNLSLGTHCVTITDSLGCISVACVTLTEPTAVTATISATIDVACFGDSSGTATVVGAGGTLPGYDFVWDNGQTTATATGLIANIAHCVTIVDANSCPDVVCATLIQAPTPVAVGAAVIANPAYNGEDVSCNGATDACVLATGAGGTQFTVGDPYRYAWGLGTDDSLCAIGAGTYIVTITDFLGCIAIDSVVVSEPSIVTAVIVTTNGVLCAGDSTGVATVTPGGGTITTGYTFVWTNGQTTATNDSLGVGPHTVTVTDNNNCSTTASVIITEPALPVSFASVNIDSTVKCFGGSDGGLTANGSGGTVAGAYNFVWDAPGNPTTGTIASLAVGTYCVTISDDNGCMDSTCVVMTEPTLLVASITGSTNISCFGDSSGIATAAATGGTELGAYDFLWNAAAGNQVTAIATNLKANILYQVTVTDDNGCTGVVNITLTQPVVALTATATVIVVPAYNGQDVSCNGATDGSVAAIGTGGTAPYTFNWGASSNDTLSIVGAGAYCVTITDALGCTATACATVVDPPLLTLAVTSQANVNCFGTSTGSATITAAAGTGAYAFIWDNGVITTVNAGLPSGVQCATVTDANLCTAVVCATITQPSAPLAFASILVDSNVTCNGLSDGGVSVVVTGGTPAAAGYIYSWTNTAQVTASITGLPANVYEVTITDSLGCILTGSLTITEPAAVTATISASQNVNCFGDFTGSATAAGLGGTVVGAYTFLWNDIAGTITASITGAPAGTYTCTVTDDNGCAAVVSVTLNQPAVSLTAAATIVSNFNGQPINCNGSTDACILATVAGGSGNPANFIYVWNTGTLNDSLCNVGAGTYIVIVTDSLGCQATDTATVVPPPVPTAFVDPLTAINVACFGTSTGSATVTTGGGTGTFDYIWSASAGSQITQTAINVPPGTHGVTVTDDNGCTASTTINISQPASAIVVAGIVVDSTVSCIGLSDGGATVTTAGGVPATVGAYTYLWDDGTSTTTASLTGVPSGTYNVTVTDSLDCIATSSIFIAEPTAVTATIASTVNVSCFGTSTGTATAVGTGGTAIAAYTYLWGVNTGSQGTATATGLDANVLYTVTVTDNNECSATASVTLSQPVAALTAGAITLTPYNGADVSCVGFTDGIVVATTAGGTGDPTNFTYNWNTGINNDTLSGVGAGTYCVTITDSLNCIAIACATVTDPPVITATINPLSVTNVACLGDSTGSATVTPGGGTLTTVYAFSWTNGQVTATAVGLAQGTHFVTVTDNNGCVVITSVIISQPASALLVSGMTVDSNASCNSLSDGGATVTASGGTPSLVTGYNYLWGNGQVTASVTGLGAGGHCVTITDSLGCTTSGCVTITEPTPVTATISATVNVSCFGDSTGTATVVGTGGTALSGYTFLWSANTGGQTTAIATGLQAGVLYCVILTDQNGCVSNNDCVTLTQSVSPVNVTALELTAVSCGGSSDGEVQATGLGGTGAITYVWSTGQTTTIVTGLAAGTYCVTATDALACQANTCVTVTEASSMTITAATVVNVVCRGDSTGEITAGVIGGATGYTFQWGANAGNRTTQAIAGLGAGNYCVVVTDANGCQDSLCINIVQPATAVTVIANVVSNYNGSQLQCFGDSSGVAVAVPSGGTAVVDYLYSWSITTQTTNTAVGLPDGTFCVTVTDDFGCTDVACVTIAEPTPVVATISGLVAVSCLGDCSGEATASGSGGTGAAYTYLWDAAAGSQVTATATGLCTGLYGVTVADANGCVGVVTVSITEPSTAIQANAIISSNYNGQDVSCNNAFNGEATASAVGGIPGYTYQWNGAALGQTTAIAANLGANTLYCVTITDGLGCQDSACVTLTEPAAVIPNVDVTLDVSCFGDSTGSSTVSATGGVGPYTFQWEVAADSQTTATATGLLAGSYTVTVIDNNGCFGAAVVIIGQSGGPLDVDAIVTSIYAGGTQIQCFGDSSGSAMATVTGGTGPYTQMWSHGPTTLGATNLVEGTYCLTITDSLGCRDSACVTLTEPSLVAMNLVSTADASCLGSCDGSATVGATGGIPGYTFLWDAGAANQIGATATGLCAGIYGVTVTDANGCQTGFNVVISEPATGVVANATVISNYNGTQISCAGANDGILVANAIGGTVAGSYTYLWSTGLITDTLSGIVAGPYCVTVTDDNGCADVACVTITEPSSVTATVIAVANVACQGDSTGTATVAGLGGIAPYTYLWDAAANNQATPTATDLAAGSYNVTVTDGNGCLGQTVVVIGQPISVLSAGATITNQVQCNGDSSGAALVTIIGGTAPYLIVWDNGPTTAANGSLPDGTYTATVTDSLGCVVVVSVTLVEPTAVVGVVTTTDALCRGDSTGTATAVASGGTPQVGGYDYLWADGQATATATGLPAGSYLVIVTDENGCTTTASGVVGEPATGVNAALIVTSNYNGAQVSCNGSSDASIDVTATGGDVAVDYTYQWSISAGSGNTDPLATAPAGTHSITVTDDNGCMDTASITVSEPTIVAATISTSTSVTCFNTCTGTATVVGSGGTELGAYSFLWDTNAGGQTTPTAINLCVGSYNVTVTDDNGCEAVAIVIISQPATGLTSSVVATSNFNGQQISCFGASDGEVTATVVGGAGGYIFSWNSNPSITNLATGLSVAGNPHCVFVVDALGCTDTACVNLVEPTTVAAVISNQTTVSCNGGTNGTATVTPVGGTGAFTYLWDVAAGGQTTPTAGNLPAGPYCVTVTDLNGCQATACVVITEPTLLAVTSAIVSNYNGEDVSCAGSCDGIVVASVVDGTLPYIYTWSTGGAGNADSMFVACVGPVTVTITDGGGCTVTATVTLTEPSAVTATIALDNNATCNGQCDGAATASGAGGTITSGYTFLWGTTAGSQTTAQATALCAGTHAVTVTDNNGCSNVRTVIITEPLLGVSASATITSNFNGQDVTCNGACDGEATAAGAGGTVTAGYTYLWNDGAAQTDAIATGLCAGVYNVTVFDNGACSNVAIITITEPSIVTATVASTVTVSCGGGLTGEATVAGSGGTAGYTYLWDATANSQTTPTATGLPGSVSICATVTDVNGCTDVVCVTISEPSNALFVNPLVTTNYNGTDISCTGVCDAAVEVQVSGGIPGYNILWGGGQIVDSISGLCAGTYYVTVSDNGGCVVEDSIIVTEPVIITASITTQQNVSCTGSTDACVEVAGAGGTPGYTYSIQSGISQANNGLFCSLAAGTYTVTVTDLNLCVTTVGVTITEPSSLPTVTAAVSSDYNTQGISCVGACDGELTATAVGGTAPYTYSWSGTSQTTATVTGMCAGIYSVIITDTSGCTQSASVTITDPPQLTGVLDATGDALCFGDATGTATLIAGGGTAPYIYTVGTQTITSTNTTVIVTGLTAGGYNATIVDANGCIVLVPVVISSPPLLTNTASVTSAYANGTMISCNGACDGAATSVGTGGNQGSTYNFLWSNGQTSFTATGLCAGTFTVSITDQNNCIAIDTVVLVEPQPLLATSSQVNISCFGDSTGSIQVAGVVGSGTPTYIYALGTETNFTGLFSNLGIGTYCVTLTDANACSVIECVTLTQNTQLQTAMIVTSNYNGAPVSCNSTNDGSVMVNVTGGIGTPAYGYQWSTGPTATNQTVNGLSGGVTYYVTVTDALGCGVVDSIRLIAPDSLVLDVTDTVHVLCFGQPTGSFTVAASGGVGPYQYSFDGGISFTNTVQYTNLPANAFGPGYCVIVRDANGCIGTVCVNINEPTQLQGLADSIIMVSCFGGADGIIAVHGVGGIAPYSYSFEGGSFDTTRIFTGLAVGVYTIDIADANGCVYAMTNLIITQPPLLVLNINTASNPTCTGICDGAIILTAVDGTPGYEYSIDGTAYQVSGVFSGLCAGAYTVYVRDAQGCITSRTVTLIQPTLITANPAVISFYPVTPATIQFNVRCAGDCNGEANATPFGGTPNYLGQYTYQWSVGGATTQTISGLCANTTYTVTVTDSLGCNSTDTVTLVEPIAIAASVLQVTNVTCAGDDDGTIAVTATAGTGVGPYTYDIGTGPTAVGTFTGLAGSLTGIVYSITVTDANGCATTIDQPIFASDAIVINSVTSIINYNGFDVSCLNASDGAATVAHTGGSAPISYLWSTNAGLQQTIAATGLSAGTYGITITDANGCNISSSVTLNAPTQLQLTTAGSSAGCNGVAGGTITATGAGGAGFYAYAIDSTGIGAGTYTSTNTWTNVGQGLYTIYVQDTNGCGPVPMTITVGADAPIVVTTNVVTPLACNGDQNAIATANATGGTVGSLLFNYVWSTTPQQSTAIATGLGGGVYFVTATDVVSGCIEISSVTIIDPDPVVAVLDASFDVTCAATATGSAQFSASGGTGGAYTYDIGAGFAPNTTGIFTGMTSGPYTVTVTDVNGCTATVGVTINDQTPMVLTLTPTNISCFALGDGMVVAAVTGGVPSSTGFGYTMSWSGPNGPITGAIDTISNLTAGLYTLQVLDSLGCPITATTTVIEPTEITITASSIVYPTCADTNGLISLLATGGPSATNGIPNAYEFSIDGGSTFTSGSNPMIFNNLPSGFYGIVVRDVNFQYCLGVYTIDLGSSSDLELTVTTTNTSCYDYLDGTATVLPSSPAGGYQYTWTSFPGGTAAGTGVTAINLQQNVTPDASGVLDTVSFYQVIVQDADGCRDTALAYVLGPPVLEVTASLIQNVNCFDGQDGAAEATVIGRDTADVSFLWTNGATTQTVNDLTTNGLDTMELIITITDSAGCIATDIIEISQPLQAMYAEMSGNTVNCADSATGTITVDTIGGGTPFTFGQGYLYSFASIGPYGSTAILTQGLAAGVYTVYAQDANGCIDSTENLIINDTINFEVTAWEDQIIDMGEAVNLYGTVNNTGIDTSLVSWSQLNPNGGNITPLPQFNSMLAITPDTLFADMSYILYLNNGCGDSSIVNITVNQEQTIFIPNVFTPNGDGFNDIFTVYGSQDVKRIKTFMVFDRWGELVHLAEDFAPNSIDPTNGWNGFFNNKLMNPGVFVYYVEFEKADGTIDERKGDVTLLR